MLLICWPSSLCIVASTPTTAPNSASRMPASRNIFLRMLMEIQEGGRRQPSAGRQPSILLCGCPSRSIEIESLLPHERTEIRPLRHAVLPRLVLGPAVERRLAPARRVTRLVRMDRSAAAVIGFDARCEIALVVCPVMHR